MVPARARQPSARGEHRRHALVAAAGELLLEGGFSAVSHRAVAGRAGVPLAATTYYFTSLDDLRAAAVQHLAAGWLERSRAGVEALPGRIDDPERLALALVDVVVHGTDDGVLTMYERYLQAGRHPELRPVVAAYDAQVDALLREVLRRGGRAPCEDDVRRLLAVVDGTVLRALAEGAPAREAACAAVTAVLAAGGPFGVVRA
ncbi:MAG: Transcriptional regulator, AcrR family [uncultured Frankineae bacterium]|uniref:Transcriptional regulator, AcrR family n=1 Tax=uncultured Frankineae bacterium TaxID=437475 RepID=A0A6J4M1L6_9ACTN|nr:MAG: Transcriptional regulator, AcrR family [uncultured Frankineae bacterium]